MFYIGYLSFFLNGRNVILVTKVWKYKNMYRDHIFNTLALYYGCGFYMLMWNYMIADQIR